MVSVMERRVRPGIRRVAVLSVVCCAKKEGSPMSKRVERFAVFLAAGILASAMALGAKPDAYQVTGNVVEINNNVIVVMKGKERFEIARDGGSKVPADVKVGDK